MVSFTRSAPPSSPTAYSTQSAAMRASTPPARRSSLSSGKEISAAAIAANVNIPVEFKPKYPDGIRVLIECSGYSRIRVPAVSIDQAWPHWSVARGKATVRVPRLHHRGRRADPLHAELAMMTWRRLRCQGRRLCGRCRSRPGQSKRPPDPEQPRVRLRHQLPVPVRSEQVNRRRVHGTFSARA